MSNIPWDLLTNKLGKYLQLSYISAVVAGACLIGEFIVRVLSGSPAQRRQSVATAISNIIHNHVNILVVIALIILAVMVAYVVGVSFRFITGTVTSFVLNWFFRLLSLMDYWSWWPAKRKELLEKFAVPKHAEPYTKQERRHIRQRGYPDVQWYDLKRPLGAFAYLWDMSRHIYPQGKELWQSITYTYGEERVVTALAAHPIHTPIENPGEVSSAAEYFRLWLNKYAPDMAITLSQTGRLIAYTFFIPVLLLPGSLQALSYDMYATGGWHLIWIIVILFLLYLIMTPGRRGRTNYELFFRFVTVQLIEQSRNESEPTQQSEFTGALTKATKQLGADQLDVRISGIYTMERIAHESAKDHPTVMETLTDFIRKHSYEQWPVPASDDAPVTERSPRPDIQTALTVIGRRCAIYDQQPIDLSYANLSRADLASANLAYANLAHANLTEADLIAANLTGATLYNASLFKARLARADLSRATLLRAQLYNADLTGANLQHTDLTDAPIADADLAGADFTDGSSPGIFPVPEGWTLDAQSGRLKRDDSRRSSLPDQPDGSTASDH